MDPQYIFSALFALVGIVWHDLRGRVSKLEVGAESVHELSAAIQELRIEIRVLNQRLGPMRQEE